MTQQKESYIAVNLGAIHNVITRGLKVSIESVQGPAQRELEDEGRRAGFFNYVRTLVSVFTAHHVTEDEVAFPYFRDKLLGAPFDLLIAQHQEMIPILEEIKSAVERCEQEGRVGAGLRDLEAALGRVNDMWHPHIQIEQEHLIEKADALLPVEEQLGLVKLFREYSKQHSGPAYLAAPFILYNLAVEERERFAKEMPIEVTGHLVPVVWKEQWASMAPFLLK